MPDHPAPRPIRFVHRGAVVEVGDAAPTRTVLDWLREDARCTGTKEGCNEGDCGACTVVVGEIARDGDADAVRGLSLRTYNACIRFLPTLDGKALFTVEDLKAMRAAAAPGPAAPVPEVPGAAPTDAPGDGAPTATARDATAADAALDALHPVQRALVECHGSQCGFCTPGFVMSLWAAYERHRAGATVPTRQQLADELSGNLCRCTGYRPILDAGQRMFDLAPVALATQPVLDALRRLHDPATFDYLAPAAAGTDAPAAFHAPKTLDALAALRERLPQARLVAGTTDVALWVNKQLRPLGELISVGDVAELKRIDVRRDADGGEALAIGAGASLEAAWTALAARWPALTDVWLRFASPPIRHAGTIGGNVANGSPIGDFPPVLMALDAAVVLRRGARVRRLPLDALYLDYMKNRIEPGEFVQAIEVPALPAVRRVRAYKISKRFDSDISALCAGLAIELDADGVVRTVRLAYGGMAATVRRAAAAEAALVGRPWDAAGVAAAQAALATDFTPLTDLRASQAYRMRVARNLLQRFWLETRADDPLPPSATSVFSVMPHAGAAA